MAVRQTLDQKIGQIGSEFNPDTINAELDHVHDRINRFIERGDVFLARKVVDNTYQMSADDSYIGADISIRAFTIKLPPIAQAIPNRVYIIKDEKNFAGTNNITVTPYDTANELIDKAASKTISSNLGVLRLISTGVEWFTL